MGGTTAEARSAERRLREAERRLRELEGELELVRRRAAEFEQQVRLAVDAAWLWLGETGERVTAALAELEELRRQREPRATPPEPEDELLRGPVAAAADDRDRSAGSEPVGSGTDASVRSAGSEPVGSGTDASVRSAGSEPVGSGTDEPVRPERFDAALSRLREQIESGPGSPL